MRELRHLFTGAGFAALILLLAGMASGCHTTALTVTVSISPPSANLPLQGTTTFFATVSNATDTTVTWQVNGVTGGNTVCGTITTNGLYTAPTALPTTTACAGPTNISTPCNSKVNGTITATSGCVLITAVSNQDSSVMAFASVTLVSGVTITVTPSGTATMGTGESLSFVATVSGTTNLNVIWLVDGTQGGTMADGFITDMTIGNGEQANAAIYTAPTPAPSPNTVTIVAEAAADTTQTQTISVTITTATPPVLNSIAPLQIPQGAILEDIYLSGSGFLSTTEVLFSGVNLSTINGGSVTAVSADVLRARLPASLLGTAGTFTVAAAEQNKSANQSLNVQVVPVRPSLLGATPVTITQNSPTTSVELSGGYFTSSTISEWNGHLVGTTDDTNFPRTILATISFTDLTEAGLFPIAVRTPAASPPRSALNVAIRPPGGPTVPNTTISGFMKPVAVAFNEISGAAVVLDQGNNQIDLLNAGFTGIAASATVGPVATSVALDGLRSLALVTDQGNPQDTRTISMISRSGGVVTATLSSALTIPGGNGLGTVIVTGVTDPSFDGNFVVLTGSGANTLTWAQTGPNAGSMGGNLITGNDLAVVDTSGAAPVVQARLGCLGAAPTAVGVDELHGRALVVNQNGSSATILDTTHPMTCPVTQSITSIARASGTVTATLANPLTIPGGNGSGIVTISGVTDASFDGTFVVLSGSGTSTLTWAQAGPDGNSTGGSAATGSVLGTVPVSNGTKPQIAVIPQMGWAIVTPGGAGTLSVVDLTRQSLVFSASITATTVGVAVNTETKTMILADPSSSSAFLFSLRDESIASLPLALGNVAAAANPFTNVGLLLNPGSHLAYLLDLSIPAEITTITLGSDPIGVALDPATNMALVVDDVDASVTVVDLGVTRSRLGEPQVFQMTPTFALASSSSVPLLITGAGFTPGSQIRLNETAIPTTVVNSRELTGTIPASFLSPPYAPVRIVVDVQNSPTLFSNVVNLLVALPVPVGNSPQGVAIDQDMDRALVANSGDNTVSVIDISPVSPTFGQVTSTLTVGSTPLAVGVVSRNGMALATNSGSSTASVIDLNTNPYTVPATVSLGSDPTGIGISESLGAAVVTNTDSNSVSLFVLSDSATTVPSGIGVDTGPVAAGVAPDLNYAVTAESTANDATIFNIAGGSPAVVNRVSSVSAASGVDYDPVGQIFLVQASGANTIVLVNPVTFLQTSIRTGVDPTSLAYNFQDGALLTLNAGSSTLSVIDLPALQVRDVLPFTAGTMYAMAIHRRLEFVLFSDPANNRVLLLPLPR